MKANLLSFAVAMTLVFCGANKLSAEEVKLVSVPLKDGVAKLTPKNSSIHFVGTHEGDKPDPRKGGFGSFSGEARVDSDGALISVELEIDTASLWTEIPKLTAHLKSPDFFDVRTYPKAKFHATVTKFDDATGDGVIAGEFTLLKATKKISVPVKVKATEKGLTLSSDFKLDRTKFGMTYGVGKVSNDVALTVLVGKPTKVPGK